MSAVMGLPCRESVWSAAHCRKTDDGTCVTASVMSRLSEHDDTQRVHHLWNPTPSIPSAWCVQTSVARATLANPSTS
eukprot:358486-Chlamydomonas_euryale.AAC.17